MHQSNNLAVDDQKQLAFFYRGEDYSNALMFLQTIPRFDRNKENSVPQKEVNDSIRVFQTEYNKTEFEISITGAATNRLNPKSGKVETFITWPGSREERVETAILKIATSGGLRSINSGSVSGYGCYFSIYQIRELTGMNANDIKQSIEIMNKSNLEIKQVSNVNKQQERSESWSATFLPVKYVSQVSGSRNDKCYVIFHPAVMSAIDNLKYRPYLYEIADSHKRSLTKYLHKRLIIKYTHANQENSYNISLRRLFNDFGKIPYKDEVSIEKLRNLVRDCRASLKDLVDHDVIMKNYEMNKVLDEFGKLIDMTIIVRATSSFIDQQIKSNHMVKKMQKNAIESEKVLVQS